MKIRKRIVLIAGALAVMLGCAGGRGGTGAYWVADRVEGDIAVLENAETQETAERPVEELPRGVKEGDMLTGGPALRIDRGATAARAERLRERFERLNR